VADPASYQELVQGILKKRTDSKLEKSTILFSGLGSMAQYGAKNPFNDVLSEKELLEADPSELVNIIHNLANYEHRILFYGQQSMEDAVAVLNQHHTLPATFTAIPEATKFEQIATTENKVYFVEYDMVQAELMLMHRGPEFTPDLLPQAKIFSEYFGGGLSSIVFQEIRESKALAYSAYAGYSSPSKVDQHHYVRGYIGTQANKLEDATSALLELMSTLPKADQQFEQAKTSALKQIETSRTSDRSILWSYERARTLGLDYDLNEKIYPVINTMTFEDVQGFFDAQIKDKPYTYMVIGKKSEMDMKALEKLGPVKELTLKQVFGY
jgi:zinc protease